VKWLRFCYGEDETFRLADVTAALAIFVHLELNECEGVEKEIEEFVKSVSKNDIEKGVTILKNCISTYRMYEEGKLKDFCEELAKIMMKKDNIVNHFDLLKDCLMSVPPHYLDIVEYGDPHTEVSEFNVRLAYINCNSSLDMETKRTIIMKCDPIGLSDIELKQLEDLGILTDKEMIELYRRVLQQSKKE